MLKEFREFALRGNVLDLAVGIIIGAAFTAIVTSLVNDIVMPPIGYLIGDVDFADLFIVLGGSSADYETLAAAQEAGEATINYGLFINAVISFLIVALAVFFLVRSFNRLVKRLEREEEEAAPEAPAEPTTEERLVAALEKLNATLEKQ